MLNRKLRIGFDLQLWDSMLFVDYIKTVIQEDLYDVYIISENKNNINANVINLTALVPLANINFVANVTEIESLLASIPIDIYCSNIINSNTIESSTIIPIIELNNIQNTYNLEPKWITKLNFWVKRLNK